MGWSVGYDPTWHRDIGYGVPAVCDQPTCDAEIDRGLAYVCGGQPYGGEHGCGLYFCADHGGGQDECTHCSCEYEAKPDTQEWIRHKLTDASWTEWRDENPAEVAALREQVGA